MRSKILKSILLACALGLNACASMPDHVPLAVAARDKIPSTEIVAPVKQSEVYIFVPQTNTAGAGAQFGLLGAVIAAGVGSAIDAQRAHNAEVAIKPLRDAMVDYSFDDTLKADLMKDLGPVGFLKVSGARVVKDGTPDGMDKAISSSKESAVLLVQADYQLNVEASTMTVNIWTDLYANGPDLAGFTPKVSEDHKRLADPAKALYHNHFWTAVNLKDAGKDRNANIAAWSADGAKQAREALDTSAAKVVADLAQDIQSLTPPPADKKGAPAKAAPAPAGK
jgi:hypothetical protein